MAYMIPRPSGTWEIRESHATPAGPRSRTLATFKTLGPKAIQRAQSRAGQQLSGKELRRMARRAGAPVEPSTADRAAADLLAELAYEHQPRPVLKRLLLEALQDEKAGPTGNAQAAAAWVGATPQKRGDTLRDLLLLVDHLPRRNRADRQRFPRIESQPA